MARSQCLFGRRVQESGSGVVVSFVLPLCTRHWLWTRIWPGNRGDSLGEEGKFLCPQTVTTHVHDRQGQGIVNADCI